MASGPQRDRYRERRAISHAHIFSILEIFDGYKRGTSKRKNPHTLFHHNIQFEN